jgi:hypothetical protein
LASAVTPSKQNLTHISRTPPPTQYAIADTGCTGHFLIMDSPCTNEAPTANGIHVTLPNRQVIRSTRTCDIDQPQLPLGARQAHKFPHLAHPLLSISQLCDHGCVATFNNTEVRITDASAKLVMRGLRDPTTNLWTIPLHNPTSPDDHTTDTHMVRPPTAAFSAYHTNNLVDHVKFLHAACGYPVPSTWIRAIESGHFATWPGLTADLVRKHLPKAMATAQGHMHQQRQNIRTTQPPPGTTAPDLHPPSDMPNIGTNLVFSAITDAHHEMATDLTGQFPVTSGLGHRYILVCYVYDCNAILTCPMKNKSETEHLRAFNFLHNYLIDRGFAPNHMRLDNEASARFKSNLRQKGIDYQLVPPHNHRRNSAERAIQTFKNHFVAILCGTDKLFPLHLWCRLLPQATATLNLLRSSRINPRLSAEENLNGTFDFNRTPLAPLGTKVLLHETPDQRRTWAPHGVEGWYVGYAPEHYRCYTIHVIRTNKTRIGGTVEFFPTHCAMPHTSSADHAIRAAVDLISALQNPAPASALAPVGLLQLQALQTLADVFSTAANTPVAAAPRVPGPPRIPRAIADLRDHNVAPARRPAAALPVPPPTAPTQPTVRPTATPVTSPLPTACAPSVPVTTPRQHATPTRVPHHYPTRARAPPTVTQDDDPHHANHVATFHPGTDNIWPPAATPYHTAQAVLHPETGIAMEYRALATDPSTKATWIHSYANELGRLAQGVGQRVRGTDTIFFIPYNAVPPGRTVTYGRIVCDYRPQKTEPERTRLTVGGNLINYPYDVSTDTADLTTAKLVINSTISTPGARHMLIDVKNYYLGTPLDIYEYMRLAIDTLPQEIVDQYSLLGLVHNGFVYLEIRKGMYGLPQAGILANQLLTKRLAPFGYYPVTHTPGLWRHKHRPILFSLVVDDFGVKYVGKAHAQHLIDTLASFYELTVDWEATKYCGITLEWDYDNHTVDLSMPNYVAEALHHFQHPTPKQQTHAPSKWTPPSYGTKVQLTAPTDASPKHTAKDTKLLQRVIGKFLYYARAVDPTMLHILSNLAAAQTKGTENTTIQMVHFLNYCATYPTATLRYQASDMILHIYSDAAYLTEPDARSRAGGHHYLGNLPGKPNILNGPILNISKVIKGVMSSAAEAEIGALYHNAKEATVIRTTLAEMGHPQPATPIETDNSTACGIMNRTVKQVRSKAIDMRFYWVRDRVEQGHFRIYWAPGVKNIADYFTKHHSPAHHRYMRPIILNELHPSRVTEYMRGCIESRVTPKVTRMFGRSTDRPIHVH